MMSTYTKRRTIILFIAVGLLLPCLNITVMAADREQQAAQLKTLNELAEHFMADVEADHLDEARATILTMKEHVLAIQFKGLVSTEGVEALLESLIQAQQSLNAISISKQDITKTAVKMRLAVDALTHPNQPMWLQYYKVLKEDGQAWQKAVAANDQALIDVALKRLIFHYEIIRPALFISRQPSEVNKMDSYLKYLLTDPHADDGQQLEMLLNELFQRSAPTTYVELASPQEHSVLWTSLIGGIIIAVLGYVAWRKYEAI